MSFFFRIFVMEDLTVMMAGMKALTFVLVLFYVNMKADFY